MKKLHLLLVAFCVILPFCSCDSNATKTSDKTDSAEDACPSTHSGDKAIETPDLTLFGFKGNVKSVTDEIGGVYNFTNDGKLDLAESQVQRDDKGRIVSYTIDELTTDVVWDKDGHVAQQKVPGQTTSYTYDDRGLLLTSYTEVDTWELSIYKYLKFDEQGNWVERERSWLGYSAGVEEGEDPIYRNKEVEKRTISYY